MYYVSVNIVVEVVHVGDVPSTMGVIVSIVVSSMYKREVVMVTISIGVFTSKIVVMLQIVTIANHKSL